MANEASAAAPGQSKTVGVCDVTGACAVDATKIQSLLSVPARSLRLEEAALVVAHLHQEKVLELEKAPKFSSDGKKLVYPGAVAGQGNRFTATVKNVTINAGTPRRPIRFLYRDGIFAPKPIVQDLTHMDVRQIVVLWRLAEALAALAGDFTVKAIVHIGAKGDDTNVEGLDCHHYGRAIDFGGAILTLPDGKEEEVSIEKHWGTQPVPDGQAAVGKAEYGFVTQGTRPNNWPLFAAKTKEGWNHAIIRKGVFNQLKKDKKVPDDDEHKSIRTKWAKLQELGLPPFTATSVRFRAGAADTVRRAETVFRVAYDVLFRHSSTTTGADMYSATAPGAAQCPILTTGAIIHPDYSESPFDREQHVDHIHAQVGPTKFEDPATRRTSPIDTLPADAIKTKP